MLVLALAFLSVCSGFLCLCFFVCLDFLCLRLFLSVCTDSCACACVSQCLYDSCACAYVWFSVFVWTLALALLRCFVDLISP